MRCQQPAKSKYNAGKKPTNGSDELLDLICSTHEC